MSHQTHEPLRKSIHIAFGLCAFTLKWLPWWVAAGVCIAAIVGNWLILHRVVGRRVARDARGFDAGIILYPVSVLALVLVFHDRLHFAAIGWAMLAFGDGVATLAGRSFPIARIPWNRNKSWGGFLAFLIAAWVSGVAVGWFLGYPHPVVILVAALCAAIGESLALNVDDNVIVPFAAAVALVVAGLQPIWPYAVWPQTPLWLLVNGALALVGFFTKSVDFSGALGGWVLGTILILGAGWPLYATLLAFFILGTLTTKLGYAKKARAGLAQEKGGRRGFSHAFANVGVAAICAIATTRLARMELAERELMFIPLFMGIAALATAAADTTASEIGQLLGKRAFLPLTLRRVPVGTEGAISVEGTLAGLAGAFVVAAIGAWCVHVAYAYPVDVMLVATLTACAFLGSYVESVVGSWNRKRATPVPNGALNFFNTAIGALLFLLAVKLFPQVAAWGTNLG
ncbi:MAG TPA: DUF92 domain-containing protein [Thermoanaerobaculia bacterium]